MIRRVLVILLSGILGAVIVIVAGFVWYLEQRPDLEIWHTAELDAEFSADAGLTSFEEYLDLEKRLFAQLDARVYSEEPAPNELARYTRGSQADPGRWPTSWNRSFELPADDPTLGVLLLHGMSDSPYSLRSLGQHLHSRGARVLGLRIPGHGTAPVGLVDVEWEDMAAAVELAVRHLRQKIGERPLLLVGYSNGGALAVQYVLSALAAPGLPKVQGVVLLSPEIGISRLAVLAQWQARLGKLIGLRKLAWNSILPEYDPFKYGSFALNAGRQAYALTEEIQSDLTRLAPTGSLEQFPPLLAFQSAVDATVTASALVSGLFKRLPAGRHELVLFDINRSDELEAVLTQDPAAQFHPMVTNANRGFVVTVVTNVQKGHREVVARRHAAGSAEPEVSPLGLSWPRDVYSLAHVALPFPPDDPVYGGPEAKPSPGIQLGDVALRGERGVLQISAADLLRLRWNPFYAYLEQRVDEFAVALGE